MGMGTQVRMISDTATALDQTAHQPNHKNSLNLWFNQLSEARIKELEEELVERQVLLANQEGRKTTPYETLSAGATPFLRNHMRRGSRQSAAPLKKCPPALTPPNQ